MADEYDKLADEIIERIERDTTDEEARNRIDAMIVRLLEHRREIGKHDRSGVTS